MTGYERYARMIDSKATDIVPRIPILMAFAARYIHSTYASFASDYETLVRANILCASGMVVTIEPGIYVPEGSSVDRSYWNLGLRMEDTYLITKNGSEPFTGVTD